MGSEGGGRRRRRIVVVGPLAALADGLREELAGQGFAVDTIAVDHVHRLADLSGWMFARGLSPAELTSQVVQEFRRARLPRRRPTPPYATAAASVAGSRDQPAPPAISTSSLHRGQQPLDERRRSTSGFDPHE